MHKDRYNQTPLTWLLSSGEHSGGLVWVECKEGRHPPPKTAYKHLPEETQQWAVTLKGEFLNPKNQWVCFPPSAWHAVTPVAGKRISIALFSPQNTHHLSSEHVSQLKSAGFNVKSTSTQTKKPLLSQLCWSGWMDPDIVETGLSQSQRRQIQRQLKQIMQDKTTEMTVKCNDFARERIASCLGAGMTMVDEKHDKADSWCWWLEGKETDGEWACMLQSLQSHLKQEKPCFLLFPTGQIGRVEQFQEKLCQPAQISNMTTQTCLLGNVTAMQDLQGHRWSENNLNKQVGEVLEIESLLSPFSGAVQAESGHDEVTLSEVSQPADPSASDLTGDGIPEESPKEDELEEEGNDNIASASQTTEEILPAEREVSSQVARQPWASPESAASEVSPSSRSQRKSSGLCQGQVSVSFVRFRIRAQLSQEGSICSHFQVQRLGCGRHVRAQLLLGLWLLRDASS